MHYDCFQIKCFSCAKQLKHPAQVNTKSGHHCKKNRLSPTSISFIKTQFSKMTMSCLWVVCLQEWIWELFVQCEKEKLPNCFTSAATILWTLLNFWRLPAGRDTVVVQVRKKKFKGFRGPLEILNFNARRQHRLCGGSKAHAPPGCFPRVAEPSCHADTGRNKVSLPQFCYLHRSGFILSHLNLPTQKFHGS